MQPSGQTALCTLANRGPVIETKDSSRSAPGVWLVAFGGAATLLTVGWLFVRSSDAPALAPASLHISASADAVAVLDGDTMRVGDLVVRLQGIAAPARGSECRVAGQDVDCGAAAANALAALVRGRAVGCSLTGHEGHGRPVGDCSAAGIGLSDAMVRSGWVHAQGAELRESEDAARTAGRGIWRDAS